MGAGKTTFIHELYAMVQRCNRQYFQPYFSIINQYVVPANNSIIYHMDLYRLKNEQEALNAGVERLFLLRQYSVVEWPEKHRNFPDDALYITIIPIAQIQENSVLICNFKNKRLFVRNIVVHYS